MDVGCGTGLISRHLHGNYVLALDINEWAIRRAKLHSSNGTHFIVGDAENLPLASNSFDVVIFTDVLEHLLTPERTLEGILRVMKPGAILVGEIPSRSVVWKFRKYLTSTCPVTEPFHHNFSMNDLRLLLNDFRIIKMCRGAFGLELVFVAQKPT